MWQHRSHLLAPLTELTKIKHKKDFVWNSTHEQAFQNIKLALKRDVMLSYPDFTIPFYIYTDASDYQLGSVIQQNNKPIAYYSRKLSKAQLNYTTTEKELLSIYETLREYRNILLGMELHVYTDHKKLLFENKDSGRVQRWRVLLEEFGPTLHFVAGNYYDAADALSRLPILPTKIVEGRGGACTKIDKKSKDTMAVWNHSTYAIQTR